MTSGGAFVTFRHGDRLRGCMGRFHTHQPLAELLVDVTRSSLADPRFVDDAITLGELTNLNIEISILGPLVLVEHPEQLIAGRHGVVISRDGHGGCFLPQVAVERDWSIETLLSECCRQKAGLEPDAWRDPATRVEAFEASVLREDGVSIDDDIPNRPVLDRAVSPRRVPSADLQPGA
jgi:AmmeMemoRadiSam system protein A